MTRYDETVRFSGKEVNGVLTPPPSKSHTHRAFFLASLSSKECVIANALNSQDTRATLGAAAAIGADVRRCGHDIRISNKNPHAPSGTVDAENSGTTMRLFTGIASMFGSPVTVTGDESLRSRPMGPLLDALSEMGVRCTSDNGRAPVTVCGPNRGGNVSIRGDISSQFVSSLMIAAPMLPDDTVIGIKGGLSSRPYVDITANMMQRFGSDVHIRGGNISVRGGTGYDGCDVVIPSDMSSAAFPLVAGALRGSVTVRNIDMDDPQGDKMIVGILRDAGADIILKGNEITSSSADLNGIDVNMGDIPDLFPIVAVLLSTAKGSSRLYGAPQLRFKESDRIKATVNMLSALGASVTETDDGCVINGVRRLKGGAMEHHEDHRILMAGAVASLICNDPVTMRKSNCYDISYPLFTEHMKKLGIDAEVQ
ncbi:MAG: 3-phosphoshikimate 1-carboxyvinyltransferase [Methanomassiliicoccaceae archaeon]|jgi:3-phosphoshikimate 1-carboxyvinyltransferase|nr:3-phosphoshikimate 1-carboxyvinyltransferase [Methanomassiliicoccaceae archaeon]